MAASAAVQHSLKAFRHASKAVCIMLHLHVSAASIAALNSTRNLKGQLYKAGLPNAVDASLCIPDLVQQLANQWFLIDRFS